RFDPRASAKPLFVGDWNYGYLSRAFHRRVAVHGQRGLPVRRAIEQSIDVIWRFQLDAVDREDVVADADRHSGRGKRRAQIRIPTLVVVDARDSVAPVLDRKVSSKQTAR